MDKEHVFFENYAETWDRDRKENPEILRTLMHLSGLAKGASVLDVGCGTGILMPYLQEAVGPEGRLEDLDYSRQMLAKAKEKFASKKGIVYTEKDVLKYKMAGQTYDAAVCLNFYPHVAHHKEVFIKKMAEALKPGGMLLLMHDMPRRRVNGLQKQAPEEPHTGVLPPVDILANLLISAGLSIVVAMDTDEFYFVKAVKRLDMPYDQYPPLTTRDLDGDPAPDARHAALHAQGIAHEHTPGHHHSHTQTRMVMNRLARISGHIEAIKRMVDEGRDCSDILIQLSAVDSALVSVGKVILRDHIDHCIVDAVRDNDLEAVENLKKAISTFIK